MRELQQVEAAFNKFFEESLKLLKKQDPLPKAARHEPFTGSNTPNHKKLKDALLIIAGMEYNKVAACLDELKYKYAKYIPVAGIFISALFVIEYLKDG